MISLLPRQLQLSPCSSDLVAPPPPHLISLECNPHLAYLILRPGRTRPTISSLLSSLSMKVANVTLPPVRTLHVTPGSNSLLRVLSYFRSVFAALPCQTRLTTVNLTTNLSPCPSHPSSHSHPISPFAIHLPPLRLALPFPSHPIPVQNICNPKTQAHDF